jgi:hypothetical protein
MEPENLRRIKAMIHSIGWFWKIYETEVDQEAQYISIFQLSAAPWTKAKISAASQNLYTTGQPKSPIIIKHYFNMFLLILVPIPCIIEYIKTDQQIH